jgi:OmcA/MtrC family decaheme c-type cytochrome
LTAPPSGFTGGPSFYIAGALPQDGVEKPADFNFYTAVALSAAANVFSAAPDADGYWTVTLQGYTLPANASMVMCYMARGYTQSDIVAADDPLYSRYRVTATKKVLVGGIPGNVARREVTSAAKCNDCHEMLGTSYITRQYGAHGASVANDPSLCGLCHSVTGASNGWSRNIQFITHAVHGVGKRTVQYNRYISVSRPNNPNGIGAYGYPGVLNDCEQCHLPGTYDFRASASESALPNLVWSTVATGTTAANNAAASSPYITIGTNYGSGFSATAQATTASLVNSPITHACSGCHDSASAIAHMKQNGGAFFESRGSLNGEVQGARLANKVETCLVCHGPDRSADIKKAHSKF